MRLLPCFAKASESGRRFASRNDGKNIEQGILNPEVEITVAEEFRIGVRSTLSAMTFFNRSLHSAALRSG